jgi:hypothetical protein
MPSLSKKLKESLSKEEIKAFRQSRNQSFCFPMLQKSILISGAFWASWKHSGKASGK